LSGTVDYLIFPTWRRIVDDVSALRTKVIFGLEVGDMWRWVTRGLVLTALMALLTPALSAQQFIASLDYPNPAVTQSGMVLVQGWVLDPQQVSKIELYVDDQFLHRANSGLP